ncbi:MAG: NAD(P)/FAD-dependent oxidoreductase [Candidatus Methylomirabilales bacterium]
MSRIVILGAGFGGLYTARYLEKALRGTETAEVVLIDRHNFHLFTPMLHEITAGKIEPRHVVWPVRLLGRRWQLTFLERQIEAIDLEGGRIVTDRGAERYDLLVLALGSVTNFYGLEAPPNLFDFKELRDAVRLRNHLIACFERAEQERDPMRRRPLLTFILAGGGCTGVELAAEIHDLIFTSLLRFYRQIDPAEIRILLLEATRRIIPCVGESLAELALEKLRQKRVEVRLETPVTELLSEGVVLSTGEKIRADTVIWTAGVRANPVIEALPVAKDHLGRVKVNTYLQLTDHPDVYALGDCVHFEDPATGHPLPPTAQVAVQQAKTVATNLARWVQGQPPRSFQYRHQGDLVSVGSRYAVAEIRGARFAGLFAWFLWRTVFLAKMIGIKNRIRVAVDWTIGLLFGRDTSRLEW